MDEFDDGPVVRSSSSFAERFAAYRPILPLIGHKK
jgi:hypothetical protein